MGDRRVRVRRAGRRLGRILAPRAVHLVHRLGRGVVRLHVLVGDGPGGRDAVMVAQFTEVLGAHPVQRGPVQLGRAAHEVMHLRLEERLGLRVVPAVRRDVAAVHEHVHGGPVLRLAGQPVAALKQQDPLARGGEVAGQRAAARPGADDDHVIVLAHRSMVEAPGRCVITARRDRAQAPGTRRNDVTGGLAAMQRCRAVPSVSSDCGSRPGRGRVTEAIAVRREPAPPGTGEARPGAGTDHGRVGNRRVTR